MNNDLRLVIAQVNPTVGALQANTERALHIMEQMEASGQDLLVFPEMFIPGYPPQDLILEKHFILENQKMVDRLAAASGEMLTLIGAIHYDGTDTYNGVAVLQNGKLIQWIHKSLLPTYDVFDEWRYFKPGRDNEPVAITFRNGETLRLGIHICEDLWDENIDYKICDILGDRGVDLFVNLSASPFVSNKYIERSKLIVNKIEKYNKPFIYVNLTGGQDQLVFDGMSMVADENGDWVHVCPQFNESISEIILPASSDTSTSVKLPDISKEEQVFKGLVLGVHDYFAKTGHTQAVLGLSGGIDSAVTAAIAVEALGTENVLGIAMPSKYSSDHSVTDAEVLAANLGMKYLNVPIGTIFDGFQSTYSQILGAPISGLPEENLQARIRGNILMCFSNKDGSLLLTTGNKTEIALGYCTLYGDMSGGLAVISDIGKRMVYRLAKYYNQINDKEMIPQNTITKEPSAELRENQVDPFDYEVVAPLVNAIIEEHSDLATLLAKGWDEELVKDLLHKVRINEYKRQQMPPGIRVSSKAFGIGRRMPIVNHYRQDK
ncbi:MAG: NAD+ synthase [Candidatus Marinimicrobia bacterium]|jgi:NAD+ synthase (glutamine-hydrolysing)|nr:NAD+ synthase [Candidatus Neomarinimicrobiota bacterium]MBT4036037.1 NAD+ synthase [Candidatus Neomarinimicrobiota bacterium]MBT4360177.1 NAD+ synthase [Candidatus Neomarinimicrobiota bacterium]MBT4713692.1 NAD+ synthase [Candidatus Neomarinimicrobiota bacterium]MBT4947546.1 NAD+ synthase [Candidatus Neomarinimicrobiota bacterium]